MELHPLIQLAAVVLGPAGAVWAVLNGTRERVKDIAADSKEIRSTLASHGERLVKIETKLEHPKA